MHNKTQMVWSTHSQAEQEIALPCSTGAKCKWFTPRRGEKNRTPLLHVGETNQESERSEFVLCSHHKIQTMGYYGVLLGRPHQCESGLQ